MLYKDLIVWQKSHALSLKVINTVDKIKCSHAGDITAKQLLRAATSVGANIAEGYGRHEGKEYIRFLEIAYGSSNEVDNWLAIMRDSGIMSAETASGLVRDNEEILRMLATMIRRIKYKSKGTPRE